MRRRHRRSRGSRRALLVVVASVGIALLVVGVLAVVSSPSRVDLRGNLDELTARATDGDPKAQMELGLAYAAGFRNTPVNAAEAFRWLEKAANQGLPEAQEAVGRMLLTGIGVPADPGASMVWYEKAAAQGRPEAEGALGRFYHDGISVPQDFAVALKWFRKAAVQGHGESKYNLGIMYAEGQGVERDYSIAGQWFRDAADSGYGFGVPKKYQVAVNWAEEVEKYRGAADAGEAEAQYRLATLLYGPEARARDIPQDREAAIGLFRSAAAKGHAMAMYALGSIYQGKISREELTGVDYVMAHMWYNLAASRLAPGPERDQAVKDRDFLAQYRLSPEQLAEAQRLAREWRPTQ
jgi:TPR repeat protein